MGDAKAVARETGWDLEGYAEGHDWSGVEIGPVGRHRDSGILDTSNFEVILEDLKERFGDAVDSTTFGHWAVGWVEEITWDAARDDVRAVVESWREALEGYPVASEEDYSAREYEDALETLEMCYSVPEDRVTEVFSYLFNAFSRSSGEEMRQDEVDQALTALGINVDA